MTRTAFFGVIVRSTGLLLALYGVYLFVAYAWGTVMTLMLSPRSAQFSLPYFLASVLGPAAGYVIAGWIFVRRAEWFVRYAYPNPIGACQKCGYDLRGSPDRCPECGTIP